MEPTGQGQLFQRYWRTFLPIWLAPLPMLGAVLVSDFASQEFASVVLPYVVLGILIYIIVAEIRIIAPWRRGEITYWQSWILSLPLVAVGLLCVLLRALVLHCVARL
jgi:hypothetical protein